MNRERSAAIRVVIPAYRAAPTLPACLQALKAISSKASFEVVVVDDGENGNLASLCCADFITSMATEKHSGPAIARNLAAKSFGGEILVFLDADVEIEPNAIDLLIAPIVDGRAEATVGNYSDKVEGLSFYQQYKQLYTAWVYSRSTGYLQNEFWTAIGAVKASCFHSVGRFDPTCFVVPQEDTHFGVRLSAAGMRILAVPEAKGRHLKRYNLKRTLLNDLRKGTSATCLIFFHGLRITDNRHVSRMDIFAVSCAYGAVALPLAVAQGSFLVAALASITLGLCYALVRSRFLRIYCQRGAGFLARACCLTYILDLVRGFSGALGVSLAAIRTAAKVLKPPRVGDSTMLATNVSSSAPNDKEPN